MKVYIECTHSVGSRGSRKDDTADKVGRHGGGGPASFGGMQKHRAAQN